MWLCCYAVDLFWVVCMFGWSCCVASRKKSEHKKKGNERRQEKQIENGENDTHD